MSTSRSSAPRVAEYSDSIDDVASGGARGARARSGGRDRVSSRGGHLSAERRHRDPIGRSAGPDGRRQSAGTGRVPRRQAAPATVSASFRRTPAAVALAKAATEASAASEREVAAEAAKREEAVTADKAERRTQLAIFGGIALVVTTGVAYSVYRAARTSPLRGLAVCLIELGVLTSALAYPVVELWNRLKISNLVLSSWLPGLFAGIVLAGVGVIVLALELTRKSTRPKAAPARDAKPSAPVELIKPGDHVKTGEPGKPGEPVRPLTPVRPLEPVRPLDGGRAGRAREACRHARAGGRRLSGRPTRRVSPARRSSLPGTIRGHAGVCPLRPEALSDCLRARGLWRVGAVLRDDGGGRDGSRPARRARVGSMEGGRARRRSRVWNRPDRRLAAGPRRAPTRRRRSDARDAGDRPRAARSTITWFRPTSARPGWRAASTISSRPAWWKSICETCARSTAKRRACSGRAAATCSSATIPHFIMTTGMPTHFDRASGESVAIETYVHLMSDHVTAARAVELSLVEMRERLVDDRWIALKPRWEPYRHHPVSFVMAWQRAVVSLLDPCLRHPDRVLVSRLRGLERQAEQRAHVVRADPSVVELTHESPGDASDCRSPRRIATRSAIRGARVSIIIVATPQLAYWSLVSSADVLLVIARRLAAAWMPSRAGSISPPEFPDDRVGAARACGRSAHLIRSAGFSARDHAGRWRMSAGSSERDDISLSSVSVS